MLFQHVLCDLNLFNFGKIWKRNIQNKTLCESFNLHLLHLIVGLLQVHGKHFIVSFSFTLKNINACQQTKRNKNHMELTYKRFKVCLSQKHNIDAFAARNDPIWVSTSDSHTLHSVQERQSNVWKYEDGIWFEPVFFYWIC